jgi:hypothetical protein
MGSAIIRTINQQLEAVFRFLRERSLTVQIPHEILGLVCAVFSRTPITRHKHIRQDQLWIDALVTLN